MSTTLTCISGLVSAVTAAFVPPVSQLIWNVQDIGSTGEKEIHTDIASANIADV